MQKATKKQEQ